MVAPRDPQDGLGQKNVSDKKDLMKKPLNQLTKDELSSLSVKFGTPDFPFPMVGTITVEHEGQKSLERKLTAIADHDTPLSVISNRDHDVAFGLLMRNLPTRSMLPMFKEILERLEPDSKNRQYFIMGQPGRGKSHTGNAISKIMSDEPARVYDCGGKNMNAMLFEMILDFGAGDALPAQIEARMNAGTLDPLSIGFLDQLTDLKIEVKDENGKVIKNITFAEKTGHGQYEIDWEALSRGSASSNEIVSKVHSVVTTIANIEGFDKAGGNMLGMNSQFGPAIIDFMEGNFATWDEYNKSKEGGDDQLQTFLQFLNGEIDECVVENPLKGKDGVSGPDSFTFKREDVKPGWGVLITGNNAIDGTTTRELNKSVYSRLGPEELPEVNEKDWQDFLSSFMTGVPISLLYDCPAYTELADNDPRAFSEFLWEIRTWGLTDDEIKAIPAEQKEWINEWQRVYSATEKLGKFYHGWRMALDAENPNNFEHMMDIDDPDFAAKQAIDFRRVIKDLRYALKIRAQQQPETFKLRQLPNRKAFNEAAQRTTGKSVTQDPTTYFGTRLTNLLNNRVYENSAALGKGGLFAVLKQLSVDCGLTEMNLEEAARSNVRTVEAELNISRAESSDPRIRSQVAQEIFCKMARERFPDTGDQSADAAPFIAENVTNDQIITQENISEIIDDLSGHADAAREKNEIYLQNQNLVDMFDHPFMTAKLFDLLDPQASLELEDTAFDDILTQDELLEGFVIPGIKDYNLNSIWEDNASAALYIKNLDHQIKKIQEVKAGNEQELAETKKGLQAQERALQENQAPRADIKDKIKTIKSDIERLENSLKQADQDIDVKKEKIQEIHTNGLSAVKSEETKNANDDSPLDVEMVEHDGPLNVAEDRFQTGLAVTTICCRIEDDPDVEIDDNTPLMMSRLHIVKSGTSDQTLVVGHKVKPSLQEAFAQAKVVYVDVKDEKAAQKIDAAVSEIVLGQDMDTTMHLLTGAFKLRNNDLNGDEGAPDMTDASLGDLITKCDDFDYEQNLMREGNNQLQCKFFIKPYTP